MGQQCLVLFLLICILFHYVVLISLEQPSYTVREDLTDGKGFVLLICAVAQELLQSSTVVLEVLNNTATGKVHYICTYCLLAILHIIYSSLDSLYIIEEDDFVAMEQLLTFSPISNTRQCGCIQIINDAINETSEVFTVRLQGTNGQELQGTTTATVTILDDDSGMHCTVILCYASLPIKLLASKHMYHSGAYM